MMPDGRRSGSNSSSGCTPCETRCTHTHCTALHHTCTPTHSRDDNNCECLFRGLHTSCCCGCDAVLVRRRCGMPGRAERCDAAHNFRRIGDRKQGTGWTGGSGGGGVSGRMDGSALAVADRCATHAQTHGALCTTNTTAPREEQRKKRNIYYTHML